MFRPKNFYSVLTPMYYATKIFGLAPFNVNSRCFTRSKINVFWSFCLMIFLNTYTSIGLNARPPGAYDQKFIAKVADLSAAYLTQLSLCFGILFACIFLNTVLKSIKEINKFDKYAHVNFGIDLMKEYRNSKICIIVSLLITTIYITLVVGLSAWPTLDIFNLSFVGEFMAYVAPEVINTFVEFQFCALILSLKQRFAWLNNTIILVSQSLNSKLQECDNIFSVTTKESEKRPTTHIVATGFLQDRAMEIIEKIRLKHHDLCTVCKNINQAYSVQILLIVITTFITIIVLVYYAGKHLLLDSYVPVDYLFYCFIQISLAIAQVVALVVVCSKTTVEAHKTGILIHNAISLQQQYSCKDDLQLGISSFSLQLLHQNVEFTACRIFVIDEGLLVSIIGAVTTYLVIVIQFEVAEHRKK